MAGEKVTVPSRSDEGLFYHEVLNLSVKVLMEDGTPNCSMVFGIDRARSDEIGGFRRSLSDLGDKVGSEDELITSLQTPSGETYALGGPVAVANLTYHVVMEGEPAH